MRKISDLLRETREGKGLSLDTVEKETKIKKEFLEAIEKGDFHSLPSGSHAQGFVKNYSKHLGISLSYALPLFRREYKSKHGFHIIPEFIQTSHKFNRKILLNSRTFLFGLALFVVGAYVFFQYSSFFFSPPLKIESPKHGEVLSSNIVEITGRTDPYATVTINNDNVYVTIQGVFNKSEYMFSGDNKITVIAKNRFGKETKKEITVRVR